MIYYQVGKSLFKWTHFLVKLLCSVTDGPVQSLCVRSSIVVIRQCHTQNKPSCQHLQCWRKKQRKKQFIYCLRFKKNVIIFYREIQKPQEVDSNKAEEAKEGSNKLSEKKEVVEETSPVKDVTKDNKESTVEEKERDTTEEGESGEISIAAGPRALHKTFSLFMRSVTPNISRADIAAVSWSWDSQRAFSI